MALFRLDLPLRLLVRLLFALQAAQVLLVLVLLALEPALAVTVLDARLVDELVAAPAVLDRVLPLQVQLVPLLVQPFEFFGRLVELDLRGLRLSHLLLELLGLAGHLDRQFLDLQSQLFDLSLISSAELLQGQVVLLFLAGGKCPLLQLLLVPVHLELELVHPLVRLEYHVLNVVQAVLLVGDPLLQFLDFVPQATALPLSDLLEVLLRFNLFVLGVDQALGVDKLHLDRLEMLFQDLEALLVLLDLQSELCDEADLLPHDLVQLLVLVVGIRWEVLVQVVLRDSVNDIVSHFFSVI